MLSFNYKPSGKTVSRTKEEAGFYSRVNRTQIAFNKSQLQQFILPGKNAIRRWNVAKGYKRYHVEQWQPGECRIRNLLLSVIEWNPPEVDLVCPLGLLTDIISQNPGTYDVVKFHDQLIVSSENPKPRQMLLYCFIGIRFEDMLKTGLRKPTLSNYTHYKSLVRGQIGDSQSGLSYLTVSEIDSVSPNGAYTEIKLTVLERADWQKIAVADNSALLGIVGDFRYCFGWQLRKWVMQCEYGMSSELVLGLRDETFTVRLVRMFTVDELVTFLQIRYPEEYAVYAESAAKLAEVAGWIKREAVQGCFQLEIKAGNEFELRPVSEEMRDRVVISEYKQWRETGENLLESCENVSQE